MIYLKNLIKKGRYKKSIAKVVTMKKEIIGGKEITFVTMAECKTRSNKQLLNILKNNDVRNLRECGCCQDGCTNRGERGTMRAVLAVGKGHGFRYLCSDHYGLNGLKGYHNSADVTYIGSKKNSDLASTPVGVEIEVVLNTEKDMPLLNILRTSLANYASARQEEDCTVCAEFPTGAFMGINSLSKLLDSFEKYNILDALTNNKQCGAHIHAGCTCVEYVRDNYKALFEPLADSIYNMEPSDRVKFFGSTFRDWAEYPDWNQPEKHQNMFNTQHQHTLEFRLPRCASAKQYLQCIKAWRAVVCEINLNHETESAIEIGRRLPAIFEKYYNFMNNYYHFEW